MDKKIISKNNCTPVNNKQERKINKYFPILIKTQDAKKKNDSTYPRALQFWPFWRQDPSLRTRILVWFLCFMFSLYIF